MKKIPVIQEVYTKGPNKVVASYHKDTEVFIEAKVYRGGKYKFTTTDTKEVLAYLDQYGGRDRGVLIDAEIRPEETPS